jgi:hypothetical protein
MIPKSYSPHPAPQTYTGTLHFQGDFAYLLTAPKTWALLQYDPHLDGQASLDAARQTATQLGYGRNDGDPLSVDGMWLVSIFDSKSYILFWDKLQ